MMKRAGLQPQIKGAHECAPSSCSSACSLACQIGRVRKGTGLVGLAAISEPVFKSISICLLGQRLPLREMLRYVVSSLDAVRICPVGLRRSIHACALG